MAKKWLTKAYNKIQEMSWEPTYVEKDPRSARVNTDITTTGGGCCWTRIERFRRKPVRRPDMRCPAYPRAYWTQL